MTELFDVRAFSFFGGIINLFVFILMFYVYRSTITYNGFSKWVIACFINALGITLISFRSFLPDYITIIMANSLIVISPLLIVSGIYSFIDRKIKIWKLILPIIILFVTFIYFTYFVPNISARIVIISGILSILYFWCFVIIKREMPLLINRRNSLLNVVFLVGVFWYVFRIFLTICFEQNIKDFMAPSVIQGTEFIFLIGMNILIMTGLLILGFQRTEYELYTAKDEIKTLQGIIPICANCKKIRDDQGYWNQVEVFVEKRTDALFSHGMCPECNEKLYGNQEWYKKSKKLK